jgi:hypothetical protein
MEFLRSLVYNAGRLRRKKPVTSRQHLLGRIQGIAASHFSIGPAN